MTEPGKTLLGDMDTGLPYVRGLGCDCDPFEDGPFYHPPDCPAYEVTRTVALDSPPAAALIVALATEIKNQDRRYGPFSPDVQGVRLAAAALEDEAEEVKKAWRDERKTEGWDEVRAEALQVAAVALRLWVELTNEAERAARRAARDARQ